MAELPPPAALELDEDFDPGRRLCPDGNCVGVLDATGRCKVCGSRGGDEARGLGPEAFGGGCVAEEAEPFEAADAPSGELGTRQLCPDGACVGVIGPNGHCSECGRANAPDIGGSESRG